MLYMITPNSMGGTRFSGSSARNLAKKYVTVSYALLARSLCVDCVYGSGTINRNHMCTVKTS